MNRAALTSALIFGTLAVTACVPPKIEPFRIHMACDTQRLPNNDRSWCVSWTYDDGREVTGPRHEYDYWLDHGDPTIATP